MFEFTAKVVNRNGFRFVAEEVDGKFIYKTTNTDEIKALKDAGFKDVTPRQRRNNNWEHKSSLLFIILGYILSGGVK